MTAEPDGFFKGVKNTELTKIIESKLGYSGRMISGSKTMYREQNPDSIVYFNACIFDETLTEVWFGDIDITKEKNKLKEIANVCEQPFYVTPEHYRKDFNKADYKEMMNDDRVIKFNEIKRGAKNE